MKNTKDKKRVRLVDDDGEVLLERFIYEVEKKDIELSTNLERERAERQKDAYLKKKEINENLKKFSELNKEMSGFFMITYVKNTLLFGEIEGLEETDIPKLMYIATFLDYSDRNGYMLVKKVQKGNQKNFEFMDRDELISNLKMSTVKGRAWLKKMSELGMLSIIDKKYIELNSKYFLKGDIDENEFFKKAKKQGNFTRVYNESIKGLYEENTLRKHKQLSYLFRLIPLAHKDLNIICRDINSHREEIDRYTFKEVVDLLCKENNESGNRARLEKDLKSFGIVFNGKEIAPIRIVTLNETHLEIIEHKRQYVILNPLISFKGEYDDMVNIIAFYFYNIKK